MHLYSPVGGIGMLLGPNRSLVQGPYISPLHYSFFHSPAPAAAEVISPLLLAPQLAGWLGPQLVATAPEYKRVLLRQLRAAAQLCLLECSWLMRFWHNIRIHIWNRMKSIRSLATLNWTKCLFWSRSTTGPESVNMQRMFVWVHFHSAYSYLSALPFFGDGDGAFARDCFLLFGVARSFSYYLFTVFFVSVFPRLKNSTRDRASEKLQ